MLAVNWLIIVLIVLVCVIKISVVLTIHCCILYTLINKLREIWWKIYFDSLALSMQEIETTYLKSNYIRESATKSPNLNDQPNLYIFFYSNIHV